MSRAALDLYEGFWTDVCDWYLELAKPRLYDESADRSSVSATLLWALERSLTLLHPVMPFVTEEIWAYTPGERRLLAVSEWPAADPDLIDEEAEALVSAAIATVTALRRYRDEAQVPAKELLRARTSASSPMQGHIGRLTRFEFVAGGDEEPAATVAVPGGAVDVLPSEHIAADRAARAEARRAELEAEIARCEGKLGNDGFVKKAPGEVVQRERDKLERFQAELRELGE